MYRLLFLGFRRIWCVLSLIFSKTKTRIMLKGNGVHYSSFRTSGVPYVMVANGGKMSIGKGFAMNNGIQGNPIGCYDRCTFFVDKGAVITIGENVGISQSSLISHCEITIGNNVKIGGGTSIYTSDFHSLDANIRCSSEDMHHRICAPVVIGDNVFIGAHCIILKGVSIGEKSIIGAGRVFTKNVPANQIWAENPAKLIRQL